MKADLGVRDTLDIASKDVVDALRRALGVRAFTDECVLWIPCVGGLVGVAEAVGKAGFEELEIVALGDPWASIEVSEDHDRMFLVSPNDA